MEKFVADIEARYEAGLCKLLVHPTDREVGRPCGSFDHDTHEARFMAIVMVFERYGGIGQHKWWVK